ncbi:tRNA 2-thiouridine(34) synthase MnmA [Candidatus Kaiserbacteria bacterium CG10_big_fil_rev_8_21_14_0_10_59_10]|uniref:tRNA-specific 2-thiouridylase MnmA n=1 Tax=Candidatus Kaiserbacteria bacterium CG10_big_fil_rev_8_21_14_0_10_59_10 TaxID=1974612 RepID=A0A2H0U721_9BACT|nr:MAG: tRNA 2-thiouridine(34) synthase MnmA [Candidatus Kaiserbacteria bacterium CG10_big_fil_rev_8_21_14_0_10_59_10]
MRVYVGLSGGVDSAVAAALLKKAGHTVVGCFIKIWQPEFIECAWRKDRVDAMRVCVALGIPMRELDLSEEYKRDIVGYMREAYAMGCTPNPDALCNRSIKFGAFAAWARREGAECIATGHYARILQEGGRHALYRGKDLQKDQSYFLWMLRERDLAFAQFPLGGMRKSDVRALAKRYALPVADKPDSQGLCFVGEVSMRDFLSRFIRVEKGSVLDESGRSIGAHDGAALYTIGQRHGFRLFSREAASVPAYVSSTSVSDNTITVTRDRERCMTTCVTIRSMHWLAGEPPRFLHAHAQLRYREAPVGVACTRVNDSAFQLQLEKPRIAARGQSLVLYEGERILGGGIIA